MGDPPETGVGDDHASDTGALVVTVAQACGTVEVRVSGPGATLRLFFDPSEQTADGRSLCRPSGGCALQVFAPEERPMTISVRGDDIDVSPELDGLVERRLSFALSRFGGA